MNIDEIRRSLTMSEPVEKRHPQFKEGRIQGIIETCEAVLKALEEVQDDKARTGL